MRRRTVSLGGLAAAALLAGGCATPRPPAPEGTSFWSGRLALKSEQEANAFSAGFELQGSPQAGQLTLLTPLGSTLALLSWTPGSARLDAQGKTRQFESVDALAAEVTGTPIPVAALFDWLRGIDTPVPGWQVDLRELARGRLRAQRFAPEADLRIALDSN